MPSVAEEAHPCRALGKDLEGGSFLDSVELSALLDGFLINTEPEVRIEVT